MRKFALLGLILAFLALGASAQQNPAEPQVTPREERPNLLQQLGLSPDQLRQVRQLNLDRKPLMDAAQRRAREANQALDATIYADNVDEGAVKARLDELQQAQADVARIRFTNELAIRKILTPDQLGRFRELRRQFTTANRDALQERRQERMNQRGSGAAGGGNPNKSLRQLVRQNRQDQKAKTSPPPEAQPKPKN